jgi:4-amino-4-deoxy-L-arabinose transferase-like glycosyltransferase
MKTGSSSSRGDTIVERLLAILLNPWFLAAAVVIILLLVSLELVKPADEAIWEYAAWLWAVHGDPPYVGCFENKPPGIFLLYRAVYAVFGLNLWPVRIFGVAAILGTMFLLYGVGRRYQGRVSGAMAALVFGLAAASQVTEGYMLAVTETFMTFFTVLAFYLLSLLHLRPATQNRRRYMLGVGAALGAALSFKQVALADAIGLVPMFYMASREDASLRGMVRDVLLVLFAGAVVTSLCLLPLLASGVTVADYWNGTWGILFSQTNALATGQRLKLIASAWTNPAMAAYYPLVLLFLFQKNRLQKAGVPFWCLLFWVGMAFLGSSSSNVFRHQIKQTMAPLALAAGLGIGVTVASTAGFSSRWVLWLYLSVVAALAPLNSVLIGVAKHTMPDAMPCPGALEEQTHRQLAAYIRGHTDPEDCIYIWAISSHPIHLYCERRSSCRYFNAIFRYAPDFETRTAADLAARPPKLIAISDPVGDLPCPPESVRRLLARDCASVCRIGDFEVFLRVGVPAAGDHRK